MSHAKNKVAVKDLQGPALDWAVAQCEGYAEHIYVRSSVIVKDVNGKCTGIQVPINRGYVWFAPSTDWAQGGPIMEREWVSVYQVGKNLWKADIAGTHNSGPSHTPLIAAMRCYLQAKLGPEVEVPATLL